MSLQSFTNDVDIIELDGNNQRSTSYPDARDDGVSGKLTRCCKNAVSTQCCGTMSTTCVSAGNHYNYFWWLLSITVVWFIASIIIVFDEKSNHWKEFESIMEAHDGPMGYAENNQTKVLLRMSVAIAMKYTESISVFMIFYNLISSALCGTLFAMLVYKYSELYATVRGVAFTSDPQ